MKTDEHDVKDSCQNHYSFLYTSVNNVSFYFTLMIYTDTVQNNVETEQRPT